MGDIMLDMSELGYPKTALPFDIFSDNMGFTTTEFEKRQYLLMNLQDRIERTLKDMTGIKNAIVTLNVPDESHYVWNEDQPSSTGSVSLTLMPSYELSPEKVSAIKNLVSDSVPRLAPENVTVVNAQTMQEMVSDDIGTTAYGLNRLDFETKVEERLENKIKNVLTLAYAPDKLRVSATVVMTSRAAVGPALRKKASSSTRTACLSLTALSPAHRGMAVSSVLFLSLSFSSFGVFCAP